MGAPLHREQQRRIRPYELQQLVRGRQAVFKARADYWGGKPAIDTVVMREVPTSAARVQLLRGGSVDIAQYLQPRIPAASSTRFRPSGARSATCCALT